MSAVLKPFNVTDALYVCRRLPQEERDVLAAISGDDFNPEEAAVDAFHYPGLHWVGVNEQGEPIFVGGFIRQRPGVFRTWFYATELAWRTPGVTTLVRDTIKRLLDGKLAHRVETVTLARCRLAQEWYVKIGLQLEATLRGFCATGENAVMWVATRDVERI